MEWHEERPLENSPRLCTEIIEKTGPREESRKNNLEYSLLVLSLVFLMMNDNQCHSDEGKKERTKNVAVKRMYAEVNYK